MRFPHWTMLRVSIAAAAGCAVANVGCGAPSHGGTTRASSAAQPRPSSSSAAGAPSQTVPDAGSQAAVDAASSALGALPAQAPAHPRYEVPVSAAELAPFASFDVGKVYFTIEGSRVALSYEFPRALSGVPNQAVSFQGSVSEPGVADLTASVGSARCLFSSAVVHCEEMMTGLATDPAAAEGMLQQGGISAEERMLRGQVIEAFSSDPIGVLTFARASADD